jgi:hypothetical protein
MKTIMIALLALTLTNCANTNYQVKKEANDGRTLDKVPQWYIDAKVDKGFIFNKNADKFIFAVGQGNSPDLQLAIEKAMMIAKAELADKLQGQMNKRTDLYITEIGSEGNKKVVSKIEETIVNVVRDTMIQGYEAWEKAVYETPNGEYRVYIGLKIGVGDANRLADYIAKSAVDAVDVDTLAKTAIDQVIITNPDGITTIEKN